MKGHAALAVAELASQCSGIVEEEKEEEGSRSRKRQRGVEGRGAGEMSCRRKRRGRK